MSLSPKRPLRFQGPDGKTETVVLVDEDKQRGEG